MLADLDETLKQLLVQKGGLKSTQVDISFELPGRDWAAGLATSRPTVNLYLYHVSENRELRETDWYEEFRGDGKVTLKHCPLRLDVCYLVTCWTEAAEDQHHLLWRVLETFFRHSPLPEELLQGRLRQLTHAARTQVAQGDGVLKNVADYWSAVENGLRPGASLVVTLDLDLEQIRGEEPAPLVFAPLARVGRPALHRDAAGAKRLTHRLADGWEEVAPLRVAGVVHDAHGRPLVGAAVRLLAIGPGGAPAQLGPTAQTGRAGGYVFDGVPPGDYTLVVEAPGRPPRQQQVQVVPRTAARPLPPFVYSLELPKGEQ